MREFITVLKISTALLIVEQRFVIIVVTLQCNVIHVMTFHLVAFLPCVFSNDNADDDEALHMETIRAIKCPPPHDTSICVPCECKFIVYLQSNHISPALVVCVRPCAMDRRLYCVWHKLNCAGQHVSV